MYDCVIRTKASSIPAGTSHHFCRRAGRSAGPGLASPPAAHRCFEWFDPPIELCAQRRVTRAEFAAERRRIERQRLEAINYFLVEHAHVAAQVADLGTEVPDLDTQRLLAVFQPVQLGLNPVEPFLAYLDSPQSRGRRR